MVTKLTAVHSQILTPDEYIISDYEEKPSGKLGYFVEKVYEFRKAGNSISEALSLASEASDYYKGKLSANLRKKAISKGLDYYLRLMRGEFTHPTKEVLVLSKNQLEVCKKCIAAIKNNPQIRRQTSPNFFEEKKFMNEFAFFADFLVTLPDFSEVTLKVKGKADSIIIDPEQKIVYLNDVKTTSKPLSMFMDKRINDMTIDGVISHHHYYRQFMLYLLFLKWYCINVLNLTNYVYRVNVWAVETTGENKAENFPINQGYLDLGKKELKDLLVRIAFYEKYGWEQDFDEYVQGIEL